ncbi:hypothetical protein KAR91_35815 [Candidatus Pacearchaeota archaeon]|jgi:hypothetical protein|nr:hypothetical protein [Candidatus Pacearchaeota archaeon]
MKKKVGAPKTGGPRGRKEVVGPLHIIEMGEKQANRANKSFSAYVMSLFIYKNSGDKDEN